MYLLVYKGKCASTIINGKKFSAITSTHNIEDSELEQFADENGKSYYDDLVVVKIAKADVVPDDGKVEKVLTVEGLKKEKKLDELQAMCAERQLDTEGSKTELAEKIVEFEASKKTEQE